MHAGHFIAVGAACLLAACSGAQKIEPPSEPVATTVIRPAPPLAVTPQPQPVRPTVRDQVRVEPEPAPIPDTLIGLAPDALDKLLGGPELVRQEGPAQFRLYRSSKAGCTLHVFLYASNNTGRSNVVEYVEARDNNGRLKGADMDACYRALVKSEATS